MVAVAESTNNTEPLSPKEVTFIIQGQINAITYPKTKAPLQRGDIVVKWGKKFKRATPKSKGPFGIVREVLPNDKVIVFSS